MGDFPNLTENRALRQLIQARAEQEGGITFRDFMEMALYHPQHGYYCVPQEKLGREGDYLTSPHLSPLFGVMVARQLREMWQRLSQPPIFQVMEMGPGAGRLARDVLAWAEDNAPGFFAALRYSLIEISAELRDQQRRLLATAGFADKATRHAELRAGGIIGCIISNELLDAFPVHRVRVENGQLMEVYVCNQGQGFREELREPSTKDIPLYFQRLGLLPGEGCYAEVNLQALDWAVQTAAVLRRGYVLTFDYGYAATDLYAPWRGEGTLLCFYRQASSKDPYRRIGRQDMTSHVDFTSVAEAGGNAGLQLLGITSQAEFLSRLGIQEALQTEQDNITLEEHFARRRAVLDLTDSAGLGRIRVMAQAKGIESPQLTGLG